MKAIILEDEKRSANRLKKLLSTLGDSIVVVSVIESIREAIAVLNKTESVDVIFADIQLSDGLSFEIFEQIRIETPIIFTTAYDQYAIKAFKVNGVDYLLKPIDVDELAKAVARLKSMQARFSKPNIAQLMSIIKSQERVNHKSRFMIKAGDRIKSISINEISAFYSQDKAIYLVHISGTRHLVDYSIEHLFGMIDHERFFRINRKYIVSIDAIDSIHAWSNSRLKLMIKNHKDDMIIVAREKAKEFKEWLDK